MAKGKGKAVERDGSEEAEDVEMADGRAASGKKAAGDEVLFDPFQDRNEKLQVRKNLRGLNDEAADFRSNPSEVDAAWIGARITYLDSVFTEGVRAPAEAVLDAKALRTHAETGAIKARNMRIDGDAFDVDEFVARVGKLMRKKGPAAYQGSDDEADNSDEDEEAGAPVRGKMDWEKLGRAVMKYSRRAPAMDVMYGPLEIQQKKRKFTQRQKLVKDDAQRIAPEQLESQDVERAENETTRNIQEMYAVLEAKGGQDGMNVFEFFVNPESFAQSIENLFQLAFLIRDGLACVETVDDEGNELESGPIIFATEPSNEEDKSANKVFKRQLVIPFDEAMWREAVEALGLEGKEPVIPTRSLESGIKVKGKWTS